jgi:ferric-dicitrate binding protein FerR (iron transport regulator)
MRAMTTTWTDYGLEKLNEVWQHIAETAKPAAYVVIVDETLMTPELREAFEAWLTTAPAPSLARIADPVTSFARSSARSALRADRTRREQLRAPRRQLPRDALTDERVS